MEHLDPKKPVEWLTEKSTGLLRREFLTLMGASMAMTGAACARRPINKIIPYVVKPEEITPGVPLWYASTCKECSANCGILVKNREGRPIKLEGNPDHPINRGALCARGQASVLNLYDPDRLKSPLKLNRDTGGKLEIPWSEADQIIAEKLKQASSGAGRVRILSGIASSSREVAGNSAKRLIHEFLSAFRAADYVEYEPFAQDEIADAQALSYDTGVIPGYRFDLAQVVVSLGADFLGTWDSPIEYSAQWKQGRKLDSTKLPQTKFSKLICFEPGFSLTGANADERIPIKPGNELKIALALAHEIIFKERQSAFANDVGISEFLRPFTPEVIAQSIGTLPDSAHTLATRIKTLAHDLWAARGKSLVVGGGVSSKTHSSLALQLVINLLNSALENEGVTVDGVNTARAFNAHFSKVTKLLSDIKAGLVDVLILHRTNPVYTLTKTALGFSSFSDAIRSVPFVVAITDREDETAKFANFVLPEHHDLENWGDANPRNGVNSLQQPTISPLFSTRSFEDSLLIWIKGAGLQATGLAAQIANAGTEEDRSWHNYLRANWKDTHYARNGISATFDQFWEGALRTGVFAPSARNTPAQKRVLKVEPLLVELKKATSTGFSLSPNNSGDSGSMIQLVLYPKISMYDGRNANNAWLQEMPDPISSVTWDNYLNVSPELARKLGIVSSDISADFVEVTGNGVSIALPARIQPGLHPAVVTAALGYGRRAAGKVGTGAGVDVYPFVTQVVTQERGRLVFSGQTVNLRKTGKIYHLASTQWHTITENRPIINDITLAEFNKNPAQTKETDPHLRPELDSLWEKHKYTGYRWGMAIDLTSCTGCGACVIGCQAENNVPVVGRDNVRVSRQMHWIKIDRYYSGTPENPEVVFQPMMCQHCENAPCETVCPVLATVHDSEGVNAQIYNRCVGTRYCQNNCPYKVRRFNFFDHWKSYTNEMNLAWNPDVTVRSRGIMEKCSFCIQRVREAKDRAKDLSQSVHDGDIKTACQQTCPTNAIVFGNINDPTSLVSKLRAEGRAFRVLEVLNTVPSVSYLSKVRNNEGHKEA